MSAQGKGGGFLHEADTATPDNSLGHKSAGLMKFTGGATATIAGSTPMPHISAAANRPKKPTTPENKGSRKRGSGTTGVAGRDAKRPHGRRVTKGGR